MLDTYESGYAKACYDIMELITDSTIPFKKKTIHSLLKVLAYDRESQDSLRDYGAVATMSLYTADGEIVKVMNNWDAKKMIGERNFMLIDDDGRKEQNGSKK